MKYTTKRFAASSAIAGVLGVSALGLGCGLAAAAPATDSGPGVSTHGSPSFQHVARRTTRRYAYKAPVTNSSAPTLGTDDGNGPAVPRTWYPEMPHQGG
jgi:hypothetical protein